MRANLDNLEETKRFNGPKSVVGPFDKIRRAGKARRVESLSFSKIDVVYETEERFKSLVRNS